MENWFIGRNRTARMTYGFDDVSLVPGEATVDPSDVNISTKIGDISLDIPLLGAAMDGVIDVKMAVEIGKMGGLGVLNLEGIFTKYENPYSVIEEIISQPKEKVTSFIQKIYQAPVKEELVFSRIQEIKSAGVLACCSCTPSK
ncbi:MAG: IMP dehydrogenase, partial [Candidatus Atribacteria bacterium]|nr:IMP dehydrogenase [Candidatus Atribacteria bacterium]MCD6349165.1 IMP dehydrogenase [Candidatus Atribacteria bacterium]